MAEQELWTYQDAVDHVIDVCNQKADPRSVRMARRAIQAASRRFPGDARWSYYVRRGKITTVASQSTGTIAYDHTGGAAERLVTLTGATFPTDAYLYKIIINEQVYPIASYVSSTTISLNPGQNPGSDVSSGASYTLFRSQYPLPINARRLWPLVDIPRSFSPERVSPEELLQCTSGNYQPSDPANYCIRNDGDYIGGKSIEFGPPPNTARTYDFMYLATGQALRTEKYETGTITTDGTTTVAGSGTTWATQHAGCVLRTSSNSTAPTNISGNLSAYNPYTDQRIILSVPSTTSLVVDAAIAALSGVAYTISDPLDIDTGPMLSAFLRLAEWQFALMLRDKNAVQHYNAYLEELRSAVKQENPTVEMLDGMGGEQYMYTLADWASPDAADGGVVI